MELVRWVMALAACDHQLRAKPSGQSRVVGLKAFSARRHSPPHRTPSRSRSRQALTMRFIASKPSEAEQEEAAEVIGGKDLGDECSAAGPDAEDDRDGDGDDEDEDDDEAACLRATMSARA